MSPDTADVVEPMSFREVEAPAGGSTLPASPSAAAGEGRGGPRAVVIGSGFGGLAAAVRLLARGYRVTVLEQGDRAGGRASTFRQDGFVFDAGPTIITAPFLFEELWTLLGRRLADDVTLRSISPFYRIRFHDGSFFEAGDDPAAMREQVRRISPGDLDGFDRFFAHSREICALGFEALGHRSFHDWRTMLATAPDLVRLQGWRSVYGLVSRFVRHPNLRIALSFHPLLVGGHPFETPSVYTLISHLERHWGVHWAMGGTGRLVSGLVGLITGHGGEVRLGARVTRIETRDGAVSGVRLADGTRLPAEVVVSNADSAVTYRDLLGGAARRRWTDRRLERARYSMSLFVWYFGTRRRYPQVPHHSILLGPRYRGLLDDIFHGRSLPEDFSLYLHRPSATDPSVAPEGCDTFYVLSPVPHLDADIDWAREAEPYRQRIARWLEDNVLPGLSEHLASSRIMTPVDFRDRLGSLKGAAFGLAPVLAQSAWFRPHNQSEEVRHLYLVGAGTHPGAGVPGVLSSARVLDEVVPHAKTWSVSQS